MALKIPKASVFVFVFLFSQGEIYGRLQWNTFKQITESAS